MDAGKHIQNKTKVELSNLLKFCKILREKGAKTEEKLLTFDSCVCPPLRFRRGFARLAGKTKQD